MRTEEELQQIRDKYGITADMVAQNQNTISSDNVSIQNNDADKIKAYLDKTALKDTRNIFQKTKDYMDSDKPVELVGDLTGTAIPEASGIVGAVLTRDKKYEEEYQTRQDQLNKLITEQYQAAASVGDTEKADKLLKMFQDQGNDPSQLESILEDSPSTKQIIGSGIRTATAILGASQILGKGIMNLSGGGIKLVMQKALINGTEGVIFGALEGAGMALEQAKETEEIIKDSFKYAGYGGVIGFGLSATLGSAGLGIRKYNAAKTAKVARKTAAAIPINVNTKSELPITRLGSDTTELVAGETSPYIRKTYSALGDINGKQSKEIVEQLRIESGIKTQEKIVGEMADLADEMNVNPKIDNNAKIITLRRELEEVKDIVSNKLDDTNAYVRRATKLGIDEGELNTIARGTSAEQAIKKDILAASEYQLRNPSTTRISEAIPAKEIIKVDDFIVKKTKEVSKVVSQNLDAMPNQPFDFSDSWDVFSKKLDDLKIIESKGKLNYSKSTIALDNSGQKLINNLYDDFIDNSGQFTPKEVDVIRKKIASSLNLYGGKLDLSNEADNILYTVRKSLLDGLDGIDPVYRQNNRNLAMLLGAENDFQTKFLGKDFSFASNANLEERVAQTARRMQGNASAPYNKVFDQIQGTAEYFGYNTGGVNIRRTLDFTDLVSKQNGVYKKTGFAGQVKTGMGLSDSADVLRAATTTRGKFDLAFKQIQKLGGDFDTKKKAAIIDLVNNYSKTPTFGVNIPQAKIIKTIDNVNDVVGGGKAKTVINQVAPKTSSIKVNQPTIKATAKQISSADGLAAKATSKVDDLVTEAKKYKSADEFIEAQTLYHGTSSELKGGKLQVGAGNVKKGGQSGGLFLSDNPKVSKVFGENIYQADVNIKNQVIDLTNKDGINKFKNYIGKSYKDYSGETLKFAKQDFDMMFPSGKADFASISQYPELVEKVVKDNKLKGIAFNEYAGGNIGKTYQILEDELPVYTKSQLTDIWNKANKFKSVIDIPEEKLKGFDVEYLGDNYKIIKQSGVSGDKIIIEGNGKQLQIPKSQAKIADITKEPLLDTLNPTGSLYVDYTPSDRATIKLADNITTLDKTMNKPADTMVTIYRGAPKVQKNIVPGDFITTNYDLAKSYTGENNVLSKRVKLSDILDDLEAPLEEEYLYRPQLTDIWNKANK